MAARLAAPLATRLAPLLAGEYVCEAALLPWLLELQDPYPNPAAGQPSLATTPSPALQLAVQLLAASLPQQRVRSVPRCLKPNVCILADMHCHGATSEL